MVEKWFQESENDLVFKPENESEIPPDFDPKCLGGVGKWRQNPASKWSRNPVSKVGRIRSPECERTGTPRSLVGLGFGIIAAGAV